MFSKDGTYYSTSGDLNENSLMFAQKILQTVQIIQRLTIKKEITT